MAYFRRRYRRSYRRYRPRFYRRRRSYGFGARRRYVRRSGYMPATTRCNGYRCKRFASRKCVTNKNWVKDYDGDYIMRSLFGYTADERKAIRVKAASNVAKAKIAGLAAKAAAAGGPGLNTPIQPNIKRPKMESSEMVAL